MINLKVQHRKIAGTWGIDLEPIHSAFDTFTLFQGSKITSSTIYTIILPTKEKYHGKGQ